MTLGRWPLNFSFFHRNIKTHHHPYHPSFQTIEYVLTKPGKVNHYVYLTCANRFTDILFYSLLIWKPVWRISLRYPSRPPSSHMVLPRRHEAQYLARGDIKTPPNHSVNSCRCLTTRRIQNALEQLLLSQMVIPIRKSWHHQYFSHPHRCCADFKLMELTPSTPPPSPPVSP